MAGENTKSANSPKIGLLLAVSGLILAVVLTVITIGRMHLRQFAQVSFPLVSFMPWIPAAICLYLTGFWLRGLRLKLLASEEAQLSILNATNIIAVGHYANNILPFRLGELVRAFTLTERTGLPFIQSLTIAVCERVFDGLAIIALLLAAAMLLPLTGWMDETFRLYSYFFLASILALFALSAVPQLLINVTTTLTASSYAGWQNRALIVVSQAVRGLSFFNSASRLLFIILLSIIIWGLEGCFFGLLLPAFHYPFDLAVSTATMGLTNLGLFSPSNPSSIGRYQYYCASALQSLEATRHLNITDFVTHAYALTVHSIYFAVTSVWGAVAFITYVWQFVLKSWMKVTAKPLETLARENNAEHQFVLATRPVKAQVIIADQFWQMLCESLIGVEALALAETKKIEAVKATSEFVVKQLSQLPGLLRIQLSIGLRVFRSYAFCTTLQPFCVLTLKRRVDIVEQWASGPLPLARKMFRPLRSLTLLGYFEQSTVRESLLNHSASESSGSIPASAVSNEGKSATQGAL